MKLWNLFKMTVVVILVAMLSATVGGVLSGASAQVERRAAATTDDLVFIHHSCGKGWLDNSLHNALLAKDYIDERNDIYYDTDVEPDPGRPDSLTYGSIVVPGDQTGMRHWIRWFNDYLGGVRSHDAATGYNRIIMFKSCYPISNISSDGTEPGDPFVSPQTLANYRAVYRHPDGPGNTYSDDGYTYKPLEDVFAENPDVLFIPVTAPPLHYAPTDATTDENAHRARVFNNWLKNDWLASYNAAHPGLNNVAVFDWFDVLTYPDDHASHPNRLRAEYGGESGNSHPNSTANSDSTQVFATNPDNFIDMAWKAFIGSASQKTAAAQSPSHGEVVTYTIVVHDLAAPLSATVYLTDVVPSGLGYVPGSLTATSGDWVESDSPTLTWSGVLSPTPVVTVTYVTTVTTSMPQTITNTAIIAVPGYQAITRTATIIANGYRLYLPIALRE
jgi:uncharacterized repeat protein (TIGR01451 family)